MAVLIVYSQTKTVHVALWDDVFRKTTMFKTRATFDHLVDQDIVPWLASANLKGSDLEFIVTNCNVGKKLTSGIHTLSESCLGGDFNLPGLVAAHALAQRFGIPAYVIDPDTASERDPHALTTGTPLIKRECGGDAFILKYLVHKEVEDNQLCLATSSFIAAHLDEEIYIGVLEAAKVVDAVTSADDGPFAICQAGGLPFDHVMDLCVSTADRKRTLRILAEESGLKAYLGDKSMGDIFLDESEYASLLKEALVYQIAKDMGAFATVLKGKVDRILLSGELVTYDAFVRLLMERIGYLGTISIYPGNQGLQALAAGLQRILSQESIIS